MHGAGPWTAPSPGIKRSCLLAAYWNLGPNFRMSGGVANRVVFAACYRSFTRDSALLEIVEDNLQGGDGDG
jgi:hypothetical protein